MTNEIERKYLITDPPSQVLSGTGVAMRQGYLALDGPVEVRLRITDAGAWLTVKAGKGLSRTEVEVPLNRDDAEALWPQTEGRRVEKRRWAVAIEDHVADLDVYTGSLEGLSTIEVEFTSEAAAAAFAAPSWFSRELTTEPGWSNAELAQRGRPE